MPNKNIDGIKKHKAKVRAPTVKSRAITKATLKRRAVVRRVVKKPASFGFILNKTYLLAALVVVIIFIAFASGMGFALRTPKSDADDAATTTQPVPAGTVATLGSVPVQSTSATSSLSGVDIFNLPLQVLQTYFQNPQTSNLAMGQRKVELKQFLVDHNSPLVDVSDTIAEQPHWQLILAISFAESTLGKNCYNFNCSGIGGATNIKSYKSFSNWILDFNRLLDQKYNNWTLQEMCGVYVKPCTNNWLNASSQILTELKQANIN